LSLNAHQKADLHARLLLSIMLTGDYEACSPAWGAQSDLHRQSRYAVRTESLQDAVKLVLRVNRSIMHETTVEGVC
jgi:hypothetical protein